VRRLYLTYKTKRTINPTIQQWDFLSMLTYPETILVRKELYGYTVHEQLEEVEFEYVKYNKGYKSCKKDLLGFIGFSAINLQDKAVVITEGVSDYLSVKACNPHLNVIGLLNLAGNVKARTFLISCFKNFVYIPDNDQPGLEAARKLKAFIAGYLPNSRFILIKPEVGYKDITQQIFAKYKRENLPVLY
jgi:hypothetical protein